MKVVVLLGSLLPITACAAGEFVVEEQDLRPVPESVASVIRSSTPASSAGQQCEYVGKLIQLEREGSKSVWAVTSSSGCNWAASAAPVWLVKAAGAGSSILLFFVTYQVSIESGVHNGMHDIATSRGTAALEEEQQWVFNGRQYELARLKANSLGESR